MTYRRGDVVLALGIVRSSPIKDDDGVSVEIDNQIIYVDQKLVEFVHRTFETGELVRFRARNMLSDLRPYRVVQGVGRWVVIEAAADLWDGTPVPDKPIVADPKELELWEKVDVREAYEKAAKDPMPVEPMVPRFLDLDRDDAPIIDEKEIKF